MAVSHRRVHVLVIPFPAPGHMLPLLDLTHLLSDRFQLSVTVAVTPKNLPQLSPLLARSPAIVPLVLPFPANTGLPPGAENLQDNPTANIQVMMCTLGGLHDPLLRWARSRLDDPPTAIISDFFCGWTESLAVDLGIPRLVFCPSGALCLAIVHSLWRRMPKPSDPDNPDELISFPNLPGTPVYRWRHLSPIYRSYVEGDPVSEFVKAGYLANMKSWAFVFNTFSDIEKPYLDHLRADLGHPRVWAVGPLAPPPASSSERGGRSSVGEEEVVAWLDGCAEGSVVYVAFGSMWVPSPTQALALAAALERSGARFVWATRGAVPVPEGFDKRVAGRGLVIRRWAPQVAILNHPAVGAFVTHCGWNSVLEATAAGVALLTWPMTADQFFNARLLEEVETAVRVCDGEEVPDPDELARLVAESVGEPGRERREKAIEMGRRATAAVAEGGSSSKDLAEMVEELRKVTGGSKANTASS
ncbi:hypothetical protein Cni_G28708 [Canna indica]|uniref:Uncharacterized protein n=1 Tax=Canna indica TaxID=4628 RepID=A0AAQ3QSK2_9LILI|nr:hypothetical protein Cni_G28708 [Canna indica]